MNINSIDCPCTKSELSFFEPRLVQTVMRSAQWVVLYPLNNVSQGTTPIEFSVSTSHDYFLDVNDSMLFLRCKVVKTDGGTNFPAGENTAPINNWMHSLFCDIQLSLGDKQIERGVHLYPYRAYLSNVFLF